MNRISARSIDKTLSVVVLVSEVNVSVFQINRWRSCASESDRHAEHVFFQE